MEEPWVRGKILVSEESGRTSSSRRPSGRRPTLTIPSRTSLWMAEVKASSYWSLRGA